jgi:hypothetical protein
MPNLSATYQVNCNVMEGSSWSSQFTFHNPNPDFDTLEIYKEYGDFQDLLAYMYMDSLRVWIKRISEIQDCYVGWAEEITNEWELLYDFGLSVGDSAYAVYAGEGTITSIEYLEVQGETRKKFIIDGGNDSYIQGVGSISHPFMPKMYVFEVSYEVCNSNLHYIGPSPIDSLTFSLNCDGQILSTQHNKLLEFNLYPNPGSSHITITTSATILSGILKVVNITGQTLDTHTINGQSIRVDTSTLKSGMYFVILETGELRAVKKLIVE